MIDIWKLNDIADCLKYPKIFPGVKINNIAIDSRLVQPGNLFIAICGANYDGHQYIKQAIERGAKALIVENDINHSIRVPFLKVANSVLALGKLAACYWKKYALPVAAVTGSCGKSSTVHMLASIMAEKKPVLEPYKNYNSEFGLPLHVFHLRKEHKWAVFEMGACHKGDINYLCHIVPPDVAVITNASPCHLDTMKNIDNVANIKGEIFQDLKTSSTAIINADDVYAAYWISTVQYQRIMTFGIENSANVTAQNIQQTEQTCHFILCTDQGSIDIDLLVTGYHNVMNALAAATTALAMGCKVYDVVSGLSKYRGIAQRLKRYITNKGAIIIDDTYNANPISVQAAMVVLRQQKNKRKIMVLGDMLGLGEHYKSMHQLVGKLGKQLGVDELLTIGQLSYEASIIFGHGAKHFQDKEDLLIYLYEYLNQETVILIKGSRAMGLEELIYSLVNEV